MHIKLYVLYIRIYAAHMLCPSPLQLSATHHVPMVLVSVWPTTHAAVLLGTLGTRALNKVNFTAHTHNYFSTCLSHRCYSLARQTFNCAVQPLYSWTYKTTILGGQIHALLIGTQTQLISSDFQPCEVNICQNGGTCTQSVDLVICDCPEGFAGKRCQTGNTRSTHSVYTLHECSTVLRARWKPVHTVVAYWGTVANPH